MKTTLIILACVLTSPMAFGQARTTSGGPTTQVNAGQGKMGTVDSFISGNSITLTSTLLTHPAKYRVAKDVKFENASDKSVTADSVRPGTRVQLGFNENGMVDEIKLLDLR